MNTTQLQVLHLKAALICAGKNDIRYYLNGVLVEVRARDTLLVSTDGHRMAIFRTYAVPEGEPDQAPAQIIIPRDTLKGIKATRGTVACVLSYEGDPLQPLAECRLSPLDGGDRVFVPIDAKFPDWRRVAPDKVTGTLGAGMAFDPYFLADFADLVNTASGKSRVYMTVHPNDGGSAAVTCAAVPEFFGVLMPMRGTGEEFSRPDWLSAV